MNKAAHGTERASYLETFVIQLAQFDGNLNRLHEYSAADFLKWCKQTKECHQKIVALPRDPNVSFTIKRKIISEYRENLTTIILNLQFHDIISQKIQRVQGIVDSILRDTKDLSKSGHMSEQFKYFLLFPKLASLNIELLTYMNMEYKRSTSEVERIVLLLQENKEVAKQIGLDSFNITNHAELFEGACMNLSLSLEKSSMYWFERFAGECEKIEEVELQDIRNSFSMESERIIFDSIFNKGEGIHLSYTEMVDDEGHIKNEVELF